MARVSFSRTAFKGFGFLNDVVLEQSLKGCFQDP